jgi:hypothetical protein
MAVCVCINTVRVGRWRDDWETALEGAYKRFKVDELDAYLKEKRIMNVVLTSSGDSRKRGGFLRLSEDAPGATVSTTVTSTPDNAPYLMITSFSHVGWILRRRLSTCSLLTSRET